MKKKTVLLGATAVMLVAAMSIGGMLAYFTDTDSEKNTFTLGDVKIEVIDEFEQNSIANPGVPVDKTVAIENTGSNAAYVRMKVVLSDGLAWIAAVDDKYGDDFDLATVFAGHDESKWSRVDYAGVPAEYDIDTDTLTYTYNYIGGKLEKGESTVPLFTSVTMPELFDNEDIAAFGDDGFTISIIGEAIQAEGFESMEEALETLATVEVLPAVEETPTEP